MNTTVRRVSVSLFCLLGIGSALSGCSSQPAVCDDVDALRTSVGKLQDVKIGDNALDTLSSDLADIQADLKKLGDDASEQYSSEVDALDSQVAGLRTSLQAAAAAPTAESIGAVGQDVQGVGSAMRDMSDAVKSTCD